MMKTTRIVFVAGCIAALSMKQLSAETVFSVSGPDAASITSVVDDFRNALGAFNAPAPVNNPDGRRQIDWDAAPDGVSAPNAFPGDFFNADFSPRARGISFSTPGSTFQLSATNASGVGVEFDNINPQYDNLFEPFSPERLFTPIDSNITDVTFANPVQPWQPAYVDGLGVVFSDVDFINVTSMDFYGANDVMLGSYAVPNYVGAATSDEHFSFLGVKFDDNVVSRVRIYTGTHPLGIDEDNNNSVDLVVMDDFIFGEPVAVPEPASLGLLGVAGLLLMVRTRRRVG